MELPSPHVITRAFNAPVEDLVALQSRKLLEEAVVAAAADVGSEEHHHEHNESHKLIGVSLVVGFVFMLLVDQIGGGHAHGGSVGKPRPRGICR